jgi:hypothetical protein
VDACSRRNLWGCKDVTVYRGKECGDLWTGRNSEDGGTGMIGKVGVCLEGVRKTTEMNCLNQVGEKERTPSSPPVDDGVSDAYARVNTGTRPEFDVLSQT